MVKHLKLTIMNNYIILQVFSLLQCIITSLHYIQLHPSILHRHTHHHHLRCCFLSPSLQMLTASPVRSSPVVESVLICGGCKNQYKDIVSRCSDCEQFMCADCNLCHKGMKVWGSRGIFSLYLVIQLSYLFYCVLKYLLMCNL